SCGCNITFASIPVQTVWSPYGAPSDPWNGDGIAPYGQYFSNLGEYVSPSDGMLTIRQTDLSVPGRRLDLAFRRVYTEPYSFLSNAPYNYERYPWAPMGDGWQLDFPWMNTTSHPQFIHLWNGAGYRIPSAFWNGPSAVYENHEGEHFRLARNSTVISLYDRTGEVYNFDPNHLNRLTVMADQTGKNSIKLNYDASNRISWMNDTIQRIFLFCYNVNGLLHSINQTINTASCSSPNSSIRGVVYNYNGQDLANVTDPEGRVTVYQYNPVNGKVGSWLISRITYPTHWYANYTYTLATTGSEAASYRVHLQYVASSL